MIVSPPVYDLTLFCQSLEGNQNARYPEPGKVCECDGHISLSRETLGCQPLFSASFSETLLSLPLIRN